MDFLDIRIKHIASKSCRVACSLHRPLLLTRVSVVITVIGEADFVFSGCNVMTDDNPVLPCCSSGQRELQTVSAAIQTVLSTSVTVATALKGIQKTLGKPLPFKVQRKSESIQSTMTNTFTLP